MMALPRPLLLALLVPAAFFLQAGTGPDAPSTRADDQPVELIFSHRYHLEEQELACDDCHDVETSVTGRDNLLPGMDVCESCHDVEDDDECGTCHSDVDDPRVVPRIETYSQPFSHQRHLEGGLECASCHAEVAMQTTATAPASLPTMVECMDCHEERAVVQECASCHLPGERLTPDSHTPTFLHTHGDAARHAELAASADVKTCQTCHDDDFCQDCHQGDNLDRFTHPLNYQFAHALDAQANEMACVACHAEAQFCIDCHRDSQVLPHTHRPGWVNNVPGDGGRHRLEALNDLQSCISCHEDNADQVCQPCHGGFN